MAKVSSMCRCEYGGLLERKEMRGTELPVLKKGFARASESLRQVSGASVYSSEYCSGDGLNLIHHRTHPLMESNHHSSAANVSLCEACNGGAFSVYQHHPYLYNCSGRGSPYLQNRQLHQGDEYSRRKEILDGKSTSSVEQRLAWALKASSHRQTTPSYHTFAAIDATTSNSITENRPS